MKPRERLSEKQRRFVDILVNDTQARGATHAAEQAGYHPSAGSRLQNHPLIAKAIEDARAKLRKDDRFGVKEAMIEAERGMDASFARGQFMAYAKLVELRAKLHGLLVEKLDVRTQTNFRINILGMPEAKDIPHIPDHPLMVENGVAHVPLPLNLAREVGPVIDESQFESPPTEEDIFGL